MDRSPYAPPKATVGDVSPRPEKYWLRTKWAYFITFSFLSFVMFSAREVWLPLFTVIVGAFALALGLLLSVSPTQAMMARQTTPLPWWWDVSLYCVLAMAVVGTHVEDPILLLVGFVPALIFCAVMTFGAWVIEVRYRVRVYSKARRFVFVKVQDGL